MDDLDDIVDGLIDHKQAAPDEVQSQIDPDIYFRYNSVNIVIGHRGSGKTYSTLREILKLPLTGHTEYTQVHYITSKLRDDTVDKFTKAFEQVGLFFNWVPLSNAEKLIDALTKAKAMKREQQSEEDYQMLCQALSNDPTHPSSACLDKQPELPHTIVIFDDCMNVFSKPNALAKQLFVSRQARITYFLLLQDAQGLSPSIKANADSLTVYGGYSHHKFNLMLYQFPPTSVSFDDYAQLSSHGCMRCDFISGDVELIE